MSKEDKKAQEIEDQFVYTCCAAQHHDKPCMLFSIMIDDQGKKWAIIGLLHKVPVEEVATWSRKLTMEKSNELPVSDG